LDILLGFGASPAKALLENFHRGRRNENRVRFCGKKFSNIVSAIYVDIEKHRPAFAQAPLDKGLRGAVEIAMNFCGFKEFAVCLHQFERFNADKVVIDAIFLTGSWLARGRRNRHSEFFGILIHHSLDQSRLSRATRGRYDKDARSRGDQASAGLCATDRGVEHVHRQSDEQREHSSLH
jgi:hypothetical protein